MNNQAQAEVWIKGAVPFEWPAWSRLGSIELRDEFEVGFDLATDDVFRIETYAWLAGWSLTTHKQFRELDSWLSRIGRGEYLIVKNGRHKEGRELG